MMGDQISVDTVFSGVLVKAFQHKNFTTQNLLEDVCHGLVNSATRAKGSGSTRHRVTLVDES